MPDTTSTTDPKARAEVTAGLRALADYLDAHPGLPVPQFSICAGLTVYPGGSEEDKRAEVDRVAGVLQVATSDFGLYRAERRFGGPVAYRVVAVPEAQTAAASGAEERVRVMSILAMILAAVALLTALAVLALLVLLVAGIRAEERQMTLTGTPRTRAGRLSRRLTGVGVRRPHNTSPSRCRYQDTRS